MNKVRVETGLLIALVAASPTCRADQYMAQYVPAASEDDCRRMAMEEYNGSAADYDAAKLSDDRNVEIWKNKTDDLLSSLKESNKKIQINTFGNGRIFDNFENSPARIANEDRDHVESALQSAKDSLGVYDKQRENEPENPDLCCDYIFSYTHVEILKHMLNRAVADDQLYETMEKYFKIRIRVISGLSRDQYDHELLQISSTLRDIYEREKRLSDDDSMMISKVLLK